MWGGGGRRGGFLRFVNCVQGLSTGVAASSLGASGDKDLIAVPDFVDVQLFLKVLAAHVLGVQLASGLLSKRLDALSPLDDGVGFGGKRQRPDRHP